MPKAVWSSSLDALMFARAATMRLLDDIPEEKLCYQPFAGANHALWIAGHLATTDNFFISELMGQYVDFPTAWFDLFSKRSTPLPDAQAYPRVSEVKTIMSSLREQLVGFFRRLDATRREAPLPERLAVFAPDYQTLPARIAWHEGMHAGQLTVIRKALGLNAAFD